MERLTPIILKKGADPEPCAVIVDAEGRSHCIPANTPWEVTSQICMDTDSGGLQVQHTIPAEKVARFLQEQGQFYGIVEVHQIRSGNSWSFDTKSAHDESTRIREQAETGILNRYVKHAKEQALRNEPIHPPAATIQAVLDSRGLDLLLDYGVQPVGYKVSEAAIARDKKMANLEKDNEAKTAQLAKMQEMLEFLMKKAAAAEKATK